MNRFRTKGLHISSAPLWTNKSFIRVLFALMAITLALSVMRPASAAISYRSASGGNNAGGATSLTINTPAGAAVGDVLIASIDQKVAAVGNFSVTTPSGWQPFGSVISAGLTKSQTYYLVLTSTPPSSYTFQFFDGGVAYTSKASGGIIAYSGVDTSNPIHLSSTGSYASSTTMNAPSITTTIPNTMIVALYAADTGTTVTQGSSMTERYDAASTGAGAGSRTTSAGQDALQASAGASGTKTMTLASGAAHVARTIALTPAPIVSQVGYRWFANNTTAGTVGSPLANQDMAAAAPVAGQPFRLRLLLGVAEVQLATSTAFKLQYKWQATGTCDATGAFSDITTSTPIKYYDNAGVADAAAIVTNGSDPVRSGVTKVTQTYEELNNFSVATAIPVNQDGMWDFALTLGNNAYETGQYCLRAVNSNGVSFGTYSQVPGLTLSPKATSLKAGSNRLYENANSLTPGTPRAATDTSATLAGSGDQFRLRTGVSIASGFKQISSGGNHTCGIASDDKAYCWGSDANGELGNGATTGNQANPVAVDTTGVLSGKTIISISASGAYTCVVASDNQAYCWGYDIDDQLGNGSSTSFQASPVAVDTSGVLSGKTILSITTGNNHTCVIASDNQAYCWGNDANGAVGNGATAGNQASPVAVDTSGVLSGKTILSITADGNHTCVVASDNQAYCWGYDTNGELGNGATTGNQASPVAVDTSGVLSGKTILDIDAGFNHTCAIASDNQAYCWGYDLNGQLGNGATASTQVSPVAVDTSGVLSGKTILSISAGRYYTCARASDSLAYCWGYDSDGELGNGATAGNQVSPVAVDTSGVLSGKTILSISAGSYQACVIASDNQAYCWGNDLNGQLGNGATTGNQVSPVLVETAGALSGKTILSVASGFMHTCAIASDNKAYCWGDDGQGQLGDDSAIVSKYSPVPVDTSGVLSGKTLVSITAGNYFTCAIASDNQAYCWGDGNVGQLGNGVTGNQRTPVAVNTSGALSGKTISKITAGGTHACVIASDNKAYCWGEDFNGQLGNDVTIADSLSPVAVNTAGVLSGKNISHISAGSGHTCTIASDNLAYCWGNDAQGQLGDNVTLANQPTPVAVNTSGVLSGKTVSKISAGNATCVVASDNLAYCWGLDSDGQLGNDATLANQPTPVSVSTSGALSGKTILDISVGGYQTCAIASDNQAYCWGDDQYGQLGNNATLSDQPTPVAVSTSGHLSGKTIVSLDVDVYHVCAVASDARAYCWGYDFYGQLGDDTLRVDQSTPVPVRENLINQPVILAQRLTLILQYAQKSAGSCSVQTGFSVITNSTPIAFSDNAGVSNGATINLLAADPVASNFAIAQAYQDSMGTFTNPTTLEKGLTGLWDFSLRDNGAPTSTTYCIRLASEDGTALGSYASYPEITTAAGGGFVDPQAGLLRGGQSVVNGIKNLFSW